MQVLAGLERIQYVFVYPDSGDLVLAGPAGMGLRFEPLDSVTLERLRRIISLEQKAQGPKGH